MTIDERERAAKDWIDRESGFNDGGGEEWNYSDVLRAHLAGQEVGKSRDSETIAKLYNANNALLDKVEALKSALVWMYEHPNSSLLNMPNPAFPAAYDALHHLIGKSHEHGF